MEHTSLTNVTYGCTYLSVQWRFFTKERDLFFDINVPMYVI